MRTSVLSVLVLGATLLLLGAGCSSFNREWKRSGQGSVPPSDIHGRWSGRWHSEANGHSGKLRCIISKAGADEYQAQFKATYMKILTFGYTALLAGQEDAGTVRFRGEADLGRLAGGTYTYQGEANPTNFFSRYSSKHDFGTFQMMRPPSEK